MEVKSITKTKKKPIKKPKKNPTKKIKTIIVYVPGKTLTTRSGKRYYREAYKYRRKVPTGKRKKHLPVRVYPGKKLPPTPPGYILDQHWDITEADERVVYTYKLEALVEYQGRYVAAFHLDKDISGEKALEFYHTKFCATVALATEDLRGQVAILNAYGHVIDWLACDLYRVTGVGSLREKHWKLIRSYDSPDAVK